MKTTSSNLWDEFFDDLENNRISITDVRTLERYAICAESEILDSRDEVAYFKPVDERAGKTALMTITTSEVDLERRYRYRNVPTQEEGTSLREWKAYSTVAIWAAETALDSVLGMLEQRWAMEAETQKAIQRPAELLPAADVIPTGPIYEMCLEDIHGIANVSAPTTTSTAPPEPIQKEQVDDSSDCVIVFTGRQRRS